MAQKRAEEVVQFFFNCLREKELKVSRIIVFGSQAKGTATEESDIDIVVVSEDFKRKNMRTKRLLWPNMRKRERLYMQIEKGLVPGCAIYHIRSRQTVYTPSPSIRLVNVIY